MQQLGFNKTAKLLDKYNIPFVKSKLATSLEQSIKFAKELGYPLALKIISKNIVHKSDAGGVKLNINNKEELISAYEALLKSAKKSKTKPEGILIQKMQQGIEVIIGTKQDPQFGAVIMFGLGGIFVELLKDVSLRIAPIDKTQAEEMINEIQAINILKGARGKKPVNISALADILTKVSKLSTENKKILELDLNPVMVDEKAAKVVDVRMMIDE